ncbi:MAG: hypothetical protein ACJAVI_005935 [Candidatus Azotimanducaceae bacterium]|jgi:hypothetical protein
MLRKLLFGFSILIFASSSSAIDANVEGKVTLVGTYGDGSIFVYIDQTIPEVGCSIDRLDADVADVSLEVIKMWLSVAMTAQATGQSVVVRTRGCTAAGFPRLRGDQTTWFFLKSPQ